MAAYSHVGPLPERMTPFLVSHFGGIIIDRDRGSMRPPTISNSTKVYSVQAYLILKIMGCIGSPWIMVLLLCVLYVSVCYTQDACRI